MDPVVGSDMLIDNYEPDEKQDVAIITPAESPEEPGAEPSADDFEAIKSRYLLPLPDLEVEAEGYSTWHIENYRSLTRKEHGPIFEVGGYPWRVLFFPYGNNVDHASFYLEQGFEDKPPENWYSCVQFVLVLWNQNDPTILHHHTANHRFNADEGDWGFTRFAELRKLFAGSWDGRDRPMVENDAVNITAYVRIYKDPTGVLWHNFHNYDSKKETGLVGLKNQGATCYLNSLLQSLYFTDVFRMAVYQIPTEQEADRSNSAWALQRLFHQLQSNDQAVSTNELTLSFGWETKHIFEQQDVQELSRILMERMEERMKGTEAENALAKTFVGKMKTYISCIDVDYESSRIEDFWDIQLNVSGNKSLDDSFKDYIQVETMDGENKYYAEGFGLQDAKKGVIFESFPQVLHLQLKRFEYDVNRDTMMKVNDRYEFPEIFDATPYLSETADRSEPYTYQLHGVLVHSGDFNAGHYYAFIKPNKEGFFYKFDDERVTRATMKEVLEENFGGDYTNLTNGITGMRNPYTRTLSTKRSMSAYMLVYIRQSRLDTILPSVPAEATPQHIAKQLAEEKASVERRRKEREEQHLYLSCAIISDDQFKSYQGFDLAIWEMDPNLDCTPEFFRLLRTSTVEDLCGRLAESRGLDSGSVRLWVMVNRQNKTFRPDQPLLEREMTVEETFTKHAGRDKAFRLWAEFGKADGESKTGWPEMQSHPANNTHVLVFLKHFDVDAQTLMGVGHTYVKKLAKVAELWPTIAEIMHWDQASMPSLALYEEIKHSMIEPMKPKMTFQQAEIQDGDVICFQKELSDSEAATVRQAGNYANAKEFYDYLLNRIVIRLLPRVPKNQPDEAFDLALNRKLTYDSFASRIAEKLGADPTHLRFSTVTLSTTKPKGTIKRNPNQSLYQILNPQYSSYNLNQRNDSLFYEVLEMSLSELEMKKALRLTWVSEGITKEEVLELLVPKNGDVEHVISELKKKANLDEDTTAGVQVYCVLSGKIQKELPRNYPVASIMDHQSLIAQRIPEECMDITEGDRTINAFHFDKEPSRPHGVPFVFNLKPQETLKDMKVRLSKRTGLKGKQLDNIKFALVSKSAYLKPQYLQDEDIPIDMTTPELSLGLDHLNRSRTQSNKGDSIFIR